LLGHVLNHLIRQLGPLGVALGAALEGETAVALGGVAARSGLFSPVLSAVAASIGSFLADQLVFWMARRERHRPFVRDRLERPAIGRALRFLERHPRLFCFGFRFVYGFRIAGPAAVGISGVPARTFVVLNALSAGAWGAIFTFVGYRFGEAVLDAVRPLVHIPHLALELGLFAALLIAVMMWTRRS